MKSFSRVPIATMDSCATALDWYLLRIRDMERTLQRMRRQTFAAMQPADEHQAYVVEYLVWRFPAPHLDGVEERVN